MALPKKLEFLNSLRAFDCLPFSLSLHYRNETFHIVQGSWGCGRWLEWQLHEMHQGGALRGFQKSDDYGSLDEY